jgi:hypothetical protein
LSEDPRDRPRGVEVFDSAVDSWIAAMLVFPPFAAAALGIHLLAGGRGGDASVMLLTAAITLAVTAALTVPCRYTLLSDALSVRCGLVCYQIPLDQIERIERSASWRSGPALSLRRVLVATSRRRYLLSPRERDRFIAELTAAVQRARD